MINVILVDYMPNMCQIEVILIKIPENMISSIFLFDAKCECYLVRLSPSPNVYDILISDFEADLKPFIYVKMRDILKK